LPPIKGLAIAFLENENALGGAGGDGKIIDISHSAPDTN